MSALLEICYKNTKQCLDVPMSMRWTKAARAYSASWFCLLSMIAACAAFDLF